MSWRLAKSLEKLREQINAAAPDRDRSSDGSIGDEAHASRSSDHNPWVRDGGEGVVTAIDISHDMAHGVDAGKLADVLRLSDDPRIKYVISNRRIADSGAPWRKYTGANPHDHHFHISVKADKAHYDSTALWTIGETSTDIPAILTDTASPKLIRPFLKCGSEGEAVERLQKRLGLIVDGDFGKKTEAAVKAFQTKHNLVADGKVGTYTWNALEV